MKPSDVLKLDAHHDVTFPNSVIEMFSGVLGVPPGGWPKKLQKIILRGAQPLKGRPERTTCCRGFPCGNGEPRTEGGPPGRAAMTVLSSLLYPDVYAKYDKFVASYGDVSVLPTPAFFYGLKSGEEIAVEIEPGKTLIIKFLTASDPHPDGTRTLFFELNGQPREVNVRDQSLRVDRAHASESRSRATPARLARPTAGLISGIAVQLNQSVKRGTKLMTLEAMKMQSNICAAIDGRVDEDAGFARPKRGSERFVGDDHALIVNRGSCPPLDRDCQLFAHGKRCKSTLPPDRITPTFLPCAPIFRDRTGAAATAPDGSTTIFARSHRSSIVEIISSSVTSETSSRR